jgi:WD40 repeat protein
VRTGAELARFDTESPTAAAAFAGPGLAVAIGDGGRLTRHSSEGKPTGTVELPFEIGQIESAPGTGRMLALSRDGRAMIVDVGSRSVIALAPDVMLTSATFSADERRIALAGVDGRLEIWDLASGKRVSAIAESQRTAAITAQFCGGDSRLMAVARDGSVTLWDAESGRRLHSVVLEPGTTAPVVTPDCAFVAAAGHGRPAVLLEVADGRPLDYIDATSGEVLSLAISRDGRTIAAPDGNRVWTWQFKKDLEAPELTRLARCELPYRVEGAELVLVDRPQRDCSNGR